MSIHHKRKPHVQPVRIPIKPHELLDKGFKVSSHSIDQWRDRVCPGANREDIYNIIIKAVRFGKYEYQWQDYYLLDGEICLVFERDKSGSPVVSTVMGRVSNIPALLNISSLIRNMKRYGKINLSLCQ